MDQKEFEKRIKSPDLHNRKTGLYLYGNLYIADEFMLECQGR